ncbi:MAG: Lrp/AsnC family transcriptional regulator [Candidatus Poseidoniaceae archaeon]|nr:Lrp/AsnC family transcriptional regulator [Candidatus Poseidoniaceae archaeon]
MQMQFNAATAIVLIVTEPGKENHVLNSLRQVKEVTESLLLFGEYDIFVKLECPDFGYLSNIVVNEIRNVDGVETTKTLTAAPILD